MDKEKYLKDLERKAYLSYHKDGILDIYLGMAIATASLNFFYDGYNPALTGILPLFTIFYAGSKKQYTIPRLGYVKFSETRQGVSQNSIRLALALGTLSFLAGLVVFWAGGSNGFAWIEPIIANWKIVLAVIFAGVFSLFGYVSSINRMYHYALLSLLVFIGGYFVPVAGQWLLLTFGGLMFLNGVIYLYRFLQEYPLEKVPEDEQ
jgi:hypothetical protein